MTVEERREVVADDTDPTVVRRDTVVEERGRRVVEEPANTYVQRNDPIGTSIATSNLIQTIVWAAVIIVVVVVGILVLVHYNII